VAWSFLPPNGFNVVHKIPNGFAGSVKLRLDCFPLDIALRAAPLVQIIGGIWFITIPALLTLNRSEVALGAAPPILIFGIVAPGWVKHPVPDRVLYVAEPAAVFAIAII
jgi:uncharacterized membrane protein